MNTVRWRSGDKVYFQNLTSCTDWGKMYSCAGYATITSPMGTKVCEAPSVRWGEGNYDYMTEKCRYK
jgi:hypothetical protein